MLRSIWLFVIAAITQLIPATASAAELWTYYFAADGSRPFYQSCYGDCSFAGTRADLAGTFTILLDWQTSSGKLISLDDKLVNVGSVRSTIDGEILYPAVPSFANRGTFPAGTSPEFAEGAFTYNQGGGQMVSNNLIPVTATPYVITFGLTNATLSLSLSTPNIFGSVTAITNARATLLNARVAGEFNNDDRIDARDYVLWRKTGSSTIDYTYWRKFYGNGTSAAVGSAVPEPSTIVLATIGFAALSHRRRKSAPPTIAPNKRRQVGLTFDTLPNCIFRMAG
jgi:hypothetical protein